MKLVTSRFVKVIEKTETDISSEVGEEISYLAKEVCDHIQALRKRFRFGWWTRKEWWPRGNRMLCQRYTKDKERILVCVWPYYPRLTDENYLHVDGYVNDVRVSCHGIFFAVKGEEEILDLTYRGNSLLTVEDIATILRTLKPYLEEIAAKQ